MNKNNLIILLLLTLSLGVQSQSKNHDTSNDKEIGVWKIKNGIFIDKKNHPKNKIAKENWKVFYSIFPKKVTQEYIKQFVLFTDGPDEKTGAVVAINDSNKHWQLMIDITDVNFKTKSKERLKQSIYTVVHEFGHLITLNNTQIRRPVKHKKNSYITYEGEALKGSYINKFVNLYWQGSLLKEWAFIRKKYCLVEQEKCLQKLYGFYDANYEDFLTDYAAESPEEDIVESWTEFVLGKKFTNPRLIAHQKANFFYKYSELVKFRKIIRKNIRKLKK